MYTPSQYKNEDINEIKEFIRQNSFGILVSQVDGKPWATHIPLELDTDENGADIIVSHIAKANPQWQSFSDTKEVLCIFNGPHSYVSSSWYQAEEVPTWNYIAVHVYGTLRIIEEQAVIASMHKLVDKYEQNSECPISIHKLSPKTMRQVKGVVGFQIQITDIQATKKLSQGREEDHPRIIEELEKQDPRAIAVAKVMKTNRTR
ncbi:MAG: transcriptional regulator [Maribacter sp.]|jgi:transcriptional regulator